jgi:hypothetical protein
VHKDRYGNFIIEPEFAGIKPFPADLSASGTPVFLPRNQQTGAAISRIPDRSHLLFKQKLYFFDILPIILLTLYLNIYQSVYRIVKYGLILIGITIK